MSEVLYVKYNSLRKPEYQISTKIIKYNDMMFVDKTAMSEKALGHIDTIKNNKEILADYYKNIKIIPWIDIRNGVRFMFLKGKKLLEDIETIEDKISYIKSKLEIIYNVNARYVTSFKKTSELVEIFGDIDFDEGEEAFSLCNLDSIFDNYIVYKNLIWCLDYEWVFPVIIPKKFLEYRTLAYVYNYTSETLRDEMSEKDFFGAFNISYDDLSLFKEMEDSFQEYVRGKGQKYLYTKNYQKNNISFQDILCDMENKQQHIKNQDLIINDKDTNINNLNEMITAKDNHIANLENQIKSIKEEKEQQAKDYDSLLQYEIKRRDNDIIYRDGLLTIKDNQIAHLTKMTRNPLYWSYSLSKKLFKKLYRVFETKKHREKREEREEIERIGIYKYKYKNLMELDKIDYESWIERVESKYPEKKRLEYNPKISILVPVYNVLDKHLIPCIESVINQTYDNWELCLADDNSTWENVKKTLKKYEKYPNIKVVYREENGHISEATNSALEIATGEFVGLLDCDDLLSPNALYEVTSKLNENSYLDFIYSDEDKVDDDGDNRHMPHFKPDWSPDTLMSNMYTCHFTVYRKSLVEKVGGLRSECNGSQDYDLALRIMDEINPSNIAHIDKILYHWREREESTSGNATVKPYVFEAAKKAKMDSLKRRGLSGRVEFVDTMYQYNVVYDVVDNPKVSVVIPSKDNYDVLKQCVDTLFKYTNYTNYEVILIDNGSNSENRKKYSDLCEKYNIKYLFAEMDFNFSKMCNIGAKKATGEYILLLNDDIEILEESKDWMEIMLGQAQVSYTGAVGAKLLYPEDRKIQHVGVINIENGPAHAFSGMTDENIYYFGRNRLNFNVLCVTAACLMVNKEKYWQVNGFDESFAVAYNDVDFCMKLVEEGYFNVVRNDVTLIHHESVSRGNDLMDINKTRRLMDEEKRMYSEHPKFAHNDPFYNKNLTQVKSDFSNNIDDYKLIMSRVRKADFEGDKPENIEKNIEVINVERYIYIEGWAFISGRMDNNDINHKLYLKGDGVSYILDTCKVYREDVERIYITEKNIEFTGFRSRFDRDEINDGKYEIGIIINGMLEMTDKILEK